MSYNRPEWHWIVLGLAGSAFMGLVMPIFAYSLSSVIAVFFVTDYSLMDQEVSHSTLSIPYPTALQRVSTHEQTSHMRTRQSAFEVHAVRGGR